MVNKIFRSSKILCSDIKSGGYAYRPKKEAIASNFIQFNTHAVTTLSVDIDYCSKDELNRRLKLLPQPSIVVETSKGFHIHYVLTYPISYKKPHLIRWASYIREQLSAVVGGDVHANGLKRVFRNPLKHTTTYNEATYTLSDFNVPFPKKEYASKGNKPVKSVDFSCVKRGSRHMTMFDHLRATAYKYSTSGDLVSVLDFVAEEANSKLEEPLSTQELKNIVGSICRFMKNIYVGSSESKAEYNRGLAKAKHDATFTKILVALKGISFKQVYTMSARAIAKISTVSNSTVSLHLTKIKDKLRQITLSNIALSYEVYKTLTYFILPTAPSVLLSPYKTLGGRSDL